MLILKEIKSHGHKCSPGQRRVGGNRRPRSRTICPVCLNVFVMDRLSRRFCSYACKVKAQSAGRRSTRKTTTKAKNAQSRLRYHVRAGNIVRPTMCEECGVRTRQIEGAHFNHDEPLRVRRLCISCHRKWDKLEPKQATYVVENDYSRRGSAGVIYAPLPTDSSGKEVFTCGRGSQALFTRADNDRLASVAIEDGL